MCTRRWLTWANSSRFRPMWLSASRIMSSMLGLVRAHFAREETLTAAQFRDQLNTSRRYVLAFLEHLDATGVTVREGDVRKLRPQRS